MSPNATTTTTREWDIPAMQKKHRKQQHLAPIFLAKLQTQNPCANFRQFAVRAKCALKLRSHNRTTERAARCDFTHIYASQRRAANNQIVVLRWIEVDVVGIRPLLLAQH
eukprot:GHVS01089000.1.p2 GENE.GHVS01089000.1~~GHVS01089000.1.p2  ORF type:complete len:110 (+),score=12.73 GHVS01089000.1:197-526(+)